MASNREEAYENLRDLLRLYGKQDHNCWRWSIASGRLDAYHDAVEREMKQLSKAEFHRGYESGAAARDVSQWKLDRMRNAAIQNLQAVEPSELCGSHEILSAICKAIFEPPMGWTIGAGEILRDHLVYLLGGENVELPAELDAEFSKNGKNHQTGGYDVLGNERDEVVRELRKLRDCGPVWGPDIILALGLSTVATTDDLCDRLIHLLGGKSINKDAETSAKVIQNGEKYQLATYDVLGSERHKAVCELRKLNSENFECKQFMGDLLSAIDPDWISKASMYDDATLNEYMRDRLIHLLGGDDGTMSNDDRTCPIAVQSPSITDELRDWVTNHYSGWSSKQAEGFAIADRIDEQFERVCSQHESVLQQTISDTVYEHERDMAELRADYERATKLQRQYGKEVAELQSRYDRLSAIRDDMTMVTRQYIDDTNELLSGHVAKGEGNG